MSLARFVPNVLTPAPGGEASPASGLAKSIVGLALLLSFLQYCLQRADLVRLVPMAVLIAGGLLFLLLSAAAARRAILRQALAPATLAIVILATAPPLLASLCRSNHYPLQYGLVMLAALFSARILLSGLGFAALLQSFFYSTSLGMVLVVGLSWRGLLASLGTERYFPLYFEPNRIAFFAVTAIPAQLWMATRSRRHLPLLLLAGLGLLVTLAASSRGSTGALLFGAAATAALALAQKRRGARLALAPGKLSAALALLIAATALAAARPDALAGGGDYLWTKLAFDSRARGLDSGFTGRTNGWSTLLEILPKTSWLTGNGYRTSDEDFDFSVDSGYLASAYELGLFSTAVILLKYLGVLRQLARRGPTGGPLLFVFFTLAVFFANGFVHRVLFGYGDPASLFALFCFVSGRGDWEKISAGSWLAASGHLLP